MLTGGKYTVQAEAAGTDGIGSSASGPINQLTITMNGFKGTFYKDGNKNETHSNLVSDRITSPPVLPQKSQANKEEFASVQADAVANSPQFGQKPMNKTSYEKKRNKD